MKYLNASLTCVSQLRPEVDFSDEFGPPFVRDSWKDDDPEAPPAPPPPSGKKSTSNLAPPIPYSSFPAFNSFHKLRKARSAAALNDVFDVGEYDSGASEDYTSEDSDDDPLSLPTDFTGATKRLTLHGLDSASKIDRSLETQTRYYGNSSSFGLVSATRELKKMHIDHMINDTGDNEALQRRLIEAGTLRREEFWKAPPVSFFYHYVHSVFQSQSFSLTAHFSMSSLPSQFSCTTS